LDRGKAYAATRQFDRAISDLNIAIEKNPNDAKAYGLRGLAYKYQDRYDKAISDFNRAVEINPKAAAQGRIYFERGGAYAMKGQYDNAISDYTKAIEIDSKNADAYYLRGSTYRDRGRYEKAISDFTKAIEIDPGHAATYNTLAWLLATCPDAAYRNGAKAVKLAKKAAELKRSFTILDTLAAAYAEAGRFEEAILTQQEVIDLLKKEVKRKETLDQSIERLKSYESHKPWREK
jgi:tetratricopeptide (TPR) repeat protein